MEENYSHPAFFLITQQLKQKLIKQCLCDLSVEGEIPEEQTLNKEQTKQQDTSLWWDQSCHSGMAMGVDSQLAHF